MRRSIRNLGRRVRSPLDGLAVAFALLALAGSATLAGSAAAAAETAPSATADEASAETEEAAPGGPDPAGDRSPASPAALSVAPLDHVEYPEERPAWVEHAPASGSLGEPSTVASGPSETPEQSADRLRVLTRAAVVAYIQRLTGAADADFFPIRRDWIDSMLVQDRYAGTLTKGGMTMHESAVALHFPPEVQHDILAAWQETQLRRRLTLVAGGTIAVVAVLAALAAGLNWIGRRARCTTSGGAPPQGSPADA